MAFYKIEDIEGIGTAIGKKFCDAGVKNTWTLLANAATSRQCKALAEKTGLDASQILKFANMADPYRIKGAGSGYAELLEVSCDDSVPELAKQNAAGPAKEMKVVNKKRSLSVSCQAKCMY